MRILSNLPIYLLLFISIGLNATETVYLATPDLSDENIIGYNVGLRPHRSSGIRLEVEHYEDKKLIHNYGHGGAGISLSWGSAQEAIRLMQSVETLTSSKTIAVLGSGVNGLTVATQLLDKGYCVRVYAKNFPPNTTSEVAAGLWDPFGVAKGKTEEEQQRFKAIETISHDYFHDLATSEAPRFGGVSFVDSYFFYRERAPRPNDPKRTLVDVEFDNGKKMLAERARHIMIETPTYTGDLKTQARNRGAQFIPYEVSWKEDLLGFDEDIIINCMGLGSREIFNDLDLKPVRGQLIYFAAQKGIDYLAGSYAVDPLFTCLFPYKEKFILGGSYEADEAHAVIVNSTCDSIVEHARLLFGRESPAKDEL